MLKSFILGAMGAENEGRDLLLNHLHSLRQKGFSELQLHSIYTLFSLTSEKAENVYEIQNCKGYQPTGLSIKYWIGAGALLIGLATTPLGNPMAPWLMGTGAGILLDTVPDLIENKQKHDRELPPYDAQAERKMKEQSRE